MTCRALAAVLALFAATTGLARADSCDALTAKLIRVTGASFAGRDGPLVVFRAADAERMSLDCGNPRRMLFRSVDRRPKRFYFVLIGLASRALAGADAEAAEILALRLHQDTLLTGEPQRGRAGPILVKCEPGDRLDGLTEGTLCRIAPTAATRSRTLRARS